MTSDENVKIFDDPGPSTVAKFLSLAVHLFDDGFRAVIGLESSLVLVRTEPEVFRRLPKWKQMLLHARVTP
jgi:hypothetical protein